MSIDCRREHAAAFHRLLSIDWSQLLLHTVDVGTLIDGDHSARSIWLSGAVALAPAGCAWVMS